MKVIIAGGRTFKDYDLLRNKVLAILARHIQYKRLEIVSGGQRRWDKKISQYTGADYLGEQFAKEYNIPIKKFEADWNKYNRSAGPIRNKEMAKYSDALIAFWDGKSKGTRDMIKQAKELNLEIRIISI